MDVKPQNTFRWKIALIAIVLLASGILLIYHSDSLRQPWRTLLSLAYGFVVVVLGKRLQTRLSNQPDAPHFGFHINWSQLAKAAGCLVAMVLWVFVALSLVGDTTAGMIILMVPCSLLGIAAAYFFSRSY
jgi:hypothetical protein